MTEIKLTKEDLDELKKLYSEANSTPVVYCGVDWSKTAWEKVKSKMDELGAKYSYDPKKVEIDTSTGEVRQRKEGCMG